MTTKLISMNAGMRLVLKVDGQERTLEWSAVCPSHEIKQPYDLMYYLAEWLEESFRTDYRQVHIPIAKPKRIKAPKRVSQAEFNRRIKELQP